MINTSLGNENVIATIMNGMQMLESRAVETTLHGMR
jgi:hypothetical protein